MSAFATKAQASFKTIVPAANTTAVDFVSNLKASSVADVCSGT
jgi:hypothetical protein